jgi:Asp-tRNA(Asn)/Glu-tRNA(Gln) amidotransferase A subunit family amidase
VQARLQHLRATGATELVLPFGVTLIARGWHDEFLWRVGARAASLLPLLRLVHLTLQPAPHMTTKYNW